MTDQELKKLRGYYHSLLNQSRILEDVQIKNDARTLDPPAAETLASELMRLEAVVPDLLPKFKLQEFQIKGFSRPLFDLIGVRSHLGLVLGRLEAELVESKTAPVTESREFSFVHDPDLRKILERDYPETQAAFLTGCFKSTIILAGSAIEAILLDALVHDRSKALGASAAPKSNDLNKWDLADLIKVALELKLVTAGVSLLSDSVRQYRNLVHPGNELRTKLSFGREEAKIAVEVLNLVHRDLSQ